MAATDGVTVHNIADRGDVILLVGVPPRAKIRVFSPILTAASPVFAAMLGPHFREGQGERSAESPKGIALPDDDPTAMTAMCRLLHFLTPQDFMDDPRPKRIFSLALAIDKYACRDALHLQSRGLLSLWLDTYPDEDQLFPLSRMAAVAHLCNHKTAFRTLTKRLIMGNGTAFSSLLGLEAGKVVQILSAQFLRKYDVLSPHYQQWS